MFASITNRVATGVAATVLVSAPVLAQGNYVIGSSAGLTGYAATLDRAWVDGVTVAIRRLNDEGGVLGKKITLVVEDNRSEPQEAVSAYRKMLSSDGAQAFVSGCLSAGNFAAAPVIIRQKIPMVVCPILPKEENLVAWMYSLLPRPAFEVDTRLQYLEDKTQIREIGILYDQSPYANLQAKIAQENAGKFGLKVVGAEQFQQNDADFSVTIKKLHAAGARAILKVGTGPSGVTAAKSLKELAVGIPMPTSTEDMSVLVEIAKVLGKDMFFVAGQTQVFASISESDPVKKAIADFVALWRELYGDRDQFWAGRGYDAMMILATAVRKANSLDGEKVGDGLNTITGYQGTSGLYNFSKDHNGVTQNPYDLAQIIDGKVVIVR